MVVVTIGALFVTVSKNYVDTVSLVSEITTIIVYAFTSVINFG